jgi:hypothetical protein
MIDVFKKITAPSNLTQAYLTLAQQMEEDGRSGRYQSWDGIKLGDLEFNSAKLIKEARGEMLALKPAAPAPLFLIPKKNNPLKMREIFIYKLKDRIKAQAIYQIIEPYFDAYLSEYLFSYRSSHPVYHAARSVARHYKRYSQRDYILVTDVSDYTGNIRGDILLDKIAKIGFDQKTLELINLFIDNLALRNGRLVKPEVGLISGTPLIALFYNIYLDDFDKYCGANADFYRRVGDDLIIFDQNKERVDILYKKLLEETSSLGVSLHPKKTKLGKASESFGYLGYLFKDGEVGLGKSFWDNTLKSWRKQFDFYYSKSQKKKKAFLIDSITKETDNLKNQFKQIAEQKKLITDQQQVREFSEAFFRALTRFFFGTYSPRNRRLLRAKIKNLGLVSVYKYFLNRQHSYGKEK